MAVRAGKSAVRNGVPAWALTWLKRCGYRPLNVMDAHVARWWAWFDCSADWYRSTSVGVDVEEHMTLHPARKVCDEWASLILNERTALGCKDAGLKAWIDERLGDFLGDNTDFVARTFGMGSGAWSADFTGIDEYSTAGATLRVRRHDAGFIVPLVNDDCESVSCAFAGRVTVGGRPYDQVQVHEPDASTGGSYHIRTWLFELRDHAHPAQLPGVREDLDTMSVLPTYAIARPAIANTYEDHTPLGVSVFDDSIDSIKLVDEAFDLSYWSLKLGHPSVFMDDRALARDPKTGDVLSQDSISQRLYRLVEGSAGDRMPITIYNPDLRVEQSVAALNNALSTMSFECGFGPGYFSFDKHQGLKTATEVVSDNSQLARNIRRHEKSFGVAIRRFVRGAWAAETALRTGRPVSSDAEVPDVCVQWDDSVIEDSQTQRATMKDDIARGLCPAYLYPMRYWGLSERQARELTGEVKGQPAGQGGGQAQEDPVPEEA